MENITLGEIAVAVAFLVGIMTGISYLHKHLKDWIASALSDQLSAINSEIKTLKDDIRESDMQACKNYLVIFLSGVEKGNTVDEIERERFWEQYEHYKKNGGNSYIKRKVEQLTSEGKL